MISIKREIFTSLLLCLILFSIAFIIRIYKVDTAPSGILVDEASFGYNAYSILKTGKDEYGIPHPLVFKAFGDQKLPLYVYLLVPFVKYFGPSLFAIRFPSVLAGSLLPVVLFFLLLEFGFKKNISFFGGIITAICPWMIILSRFGYETNVALLFFSLGILFTSLALRRKNILAAMLGGILFGITLYSYIAYRFITPPIVLLMVLMYGDKIKLTVRYRLVIITSFLLLLLPIVFSYLSPQSTIRFAQSGASYSTGLKMEINESRTYCSEKLPKIVCYLSSNKILSMLRTYSYRYINVFSPTYLFLMGEVDHTLNVDNSGLFYVWLLPFYILGLVMLINRFYKKRFVLGDYFLIFSFLIVVTPSLLVADPQKLRLSAAFPFILILITSGLSGVMSYVKKGLFKVVFITIFYGISFISVFLFLISFLTIHIQKYEADYRTYVPKLMVYLGSYNPNVQIYIKSITEGIIYYSLVNKIDPKIYQKNIIRNKPDAIGFIHSSDLLQIHIANDNLFILGCTLKEKEVHAVYISNENINDIPIAAKKIIYSENGVDTLAIIYDFDKIDSQYLHCDPQQ